MKKIEGTFDQAAQVVSKYTGMKETSAKVLLYSGKIQPTLEGLVDYCVSRVVSGAHFEIPKEKRALVELGEIEKTLGIGLRLVGCRSDGSAVMELPKILGYNSTQQLFEKRLLDLGYRRKHWEGDNGKQLSGWAEMPEFAPEPIIEPEPESKGDVEEFTPATVPADAPEAGMI